MFDLYTIKTAELKELRMSCIVQCGTLYIHIDI